MTNSKAPVFKINLIEAWREFSRSRSRQLHPLIIKTRFQPITDELITFTTTDLNHPQKIVDHLCRTYSAGKVRQMVKMISDALTYCVNVGLVPYNPFSAIGKLCDRYVWEVQSIAAVTVLLDPSQMPIMDWTVWDAHNLDEPFQKAMLESNGILIPKFRDGNHGKTIWARVRYDKAYVNAWLLDTFWHVNDAQLQELFKYGSKFVTEHLARQTVITGDYDICNLPLADTIEFRKWLANRKDFEK